MNFVATMRYWFLVNVARPRRYRALFRTIHQYRSRRIVEIGVYNGVHALQMIQTATIHRPSKNVAYFGFDLFEELTEDVLRSEFSKEASPYAAIQRKLEKTGANIRLFKGDSKMTIPAALETIGEADFVFIDGGHSIETIQSDWGCVEKMMGKDTVVIFDDYYLNTEPEIEGLGCQSLINQLDRRLYEVSVLEPTDVFRKEWGKLKVRMAMVRKAHGPRTA